VDIHIPELSWRLAENAVEQWDKIARLRFLVLGECGPRLLQVNLSISLCLQVAFFLGSAQRLGRINQQFIVASDERFQAAHVAYDSLLFGLPTLVQLVVVVLDSASQFFIVLRQLGQAVYDALIKELERHRPSGMALPYAEQFLAAFFASCL